MPVYNLTVEGCHLYYAGGILVHNCDACSQALNWMLFTSGQYALPESTSQKRLEEAVYAEQDAFLSGEIYDVYGGTIYE